MNRSFITNKTEKNCSKFGRLICAICAVVLLFIPCFGCTPRVSTDEFNALKNELANEIDHLKDVNEAAHLEIDMLKYKNEAAHQEIDTLKNNNESARQEIDSLKSSNETAQQEIDALQKTNGDMQNEIDSLSDSNDAAEQKIGALTDSNEAMQKEIASLKESNATAQQEIDALQSSSEAMQKEISSLQESYAAAQLEIERLKKQIEDLQNDSSADKIKIYIDQGHNPSPYHNAGATGNGLFEQDLTFAIGCLLAQLLEADGRFEVCLSRPTENTVLGTDNTSSLEARVLGAQEFGADYFISLHINSYESNSANGIEVFVAEQDSTSYAFGSSLLQGMIQATNLRDRGMKLNPELYVLKNATMPAALLEMGFISNAEDAALLSESPELFAQGIYNGILAYFGLSAAQE